MKRTQTLLTKIIFVLIAVAGLVAVLISLNLIVAIKTELASAGIGGPAVDAVLSPSYLSGRILTLSLYAVTLAFVVGLFSASAFIKPLRQLQQAAEKLEQGNFDYRVTVESQDELNQLAHAFNNMASRLQDNFNLLEQRVAERTKALAASAEVSHRLSTILDPKELVAEVVNQAKNTFDYYHAQIYFFDEANENLVMAGGTGEAGAAMLARGHKVPKGRGLVGRAAETNSPVLVPDVSKAADWLPNPLLPDTLSEVAIPIASGKQVLGVLDVQQNAVNGLGDDDVILLQSLAGQVAISLQNARSFEQAKSQAELESLVNVIGQKIQRAASMEETLQTAVRELGLALSSRTTRAFLKSPASVSHMDEQNAQ